MANANRSAYVLYAMEQMKELGSWCGETHIQKALFLCQDLMKLPTGFKYVLYKHGPYSFELSDQIQRLISDELVKVLPRPPYGPMLDVAEQGKAIAARIKSDTENVKRIKFLANELSKKTVSDLEKLATAEFLWSRDGTESTLEELAEELSVVKPHVSRTAARAAFQEAEILRRAAKEVAP